MVIKGPRGAQDILPPASGLFQRVVRSGEDLFALYGYHRIETPVFEHAEVFDRGLDGGSDLVTKEMYTFTDRSGRALALRPEGTAPVIRSILEHNLHRAALPVKLYYFSPSFRYERPQEGRNRAFYQLGVEAVGIPGPDIDAEVIELAVRFFSKLGLHPKLMLNSIGHPGCRNEYMPKLIAYLKSNFDKLCADCRRKTETNPLRTFDCKVPSDRKIMEGAPLISDHLCDDCQTHFDGLRQILGAASIEFQIEPRLVRGLDYYTRTTFTFVARELGAQNEIGGGGRYDGLSELLGGPPLGGIGFGLGIDRTVLALEKSGAVTHSTIDAFVVSASPAQRPEALAITSNLRNAGIATDLDYAAKQLKGQLKSADRAGARFAVIVGNREVTQRRLTVRNMSTGEETPVPAEELVDFLKGRI